MEPETKTIDSLNKIPAQRLSSKQLEALKAKAKAEAKSRKLARKRFRFGWDDRADTSRTPSSTSVGSRTFLEGLPGLDRLSRVSIPSPMKKLLLTIISEADIDRWLDSPIPMLDHRKPVDLIRSGETRELMRMLRRVGNS